MTPDAVILTAIAVLSAIGSLLSLRSNNKRTDTESKKLEDDITERVLARADKELEKMQKRLDAEIESRAADKAASDAEIKRLSNELQKERDARIEDAKRISALENELDRREKRIKELEGNSGTFPAARPSGFGKK
jgi:chromosome segregation ATPase